MGEKTSQREPVLDGYKGTARRWGIPEWTLRNEVWAGRLSVVVIGRKHYLDQGEVKNLVERNRTFATAPPSIVQINKAERLRALDERRAARSSK